MRATPKYITDELKRYDSSLGLRWSQTDECWWFTLDGEDAWAYRRRSTGAIVTGDPNLGEVMEIVKAADRKVSGNSLLSGMRKNRTRIEASYEREKNRLIDDAARECSSQVAVKRSGPKTIVAPAA